MSVCAAALITVHLSTLSSEGAKTVEIKLLLPRSNSLKFPEISSGSTAETMLAAPLLSFISIPLSYFMRVPLEVGSLPSVV